MPGTGDPPMWTSSTTTTTGGCLSRGSMTGGGADPRLGSGLTGLSDRLDADTATTLLLAPPPGEGELKVGAEVEPHLSAASSVRGVTS